MMANAEHAKAETPQCLLAFLNCGQRLARNRPSVLDPRGKACRSRLVPEAQPEFARQFTDLLLSKPRLQKRCDNAMQRGSTLARAEVPAVIHIHPVCDMVKAQHTIFVLHHAKQLVLAVKAAS